MSPRFRPARGTGTPRIRSPQGTLVPLLWCVSVTSLDGGIGNPRQ